MVVQYSNIGHLNDFFILYNTLKLLRSYLAAKGEQRVKREKL